MHISWGRNSSNMGLEFVRMMCLAARVSASESQRNGAYMGGLPRRCEGWPEALLSKGFDVVYCQYYPGAGFSGLGCITPKNGESHEQEHVS